MQVVEMIPCHDVPTPPTRVQPHLPVVRRGVWNEFFPIRSIANGAPFFLQVATVARCGRRLINICLHEATMALCGRRFNALC